MAKQVLQRLSFTAGELTPWLAGRADLDPVSRGASRLINFLVSPFGGLRRRPGTRLVARAGCREGMVRLVSFKYSTGVQFMLEVGRGYVRYFKNGALLTDTEGGVLETLTPWKTDEQVSNLRMQQLNDVIYCVEPSTPPMTLARYADDDWRLEALEFSGIPYESSLLNAVRLECRMVREGSVNRLLATADDDVFTPEMEGKEFLRITRKYGETVAEGNQMPFYHLTTLSRDLYKGETFSMNREDGWRQAYTCIRDFSRESDYQEGVDRPERYTAFFEKGADASTRIYVNGAWTLETTGTWDAEWEICRGYPDGSNYLPNRPELVWHSVKSFQQREGFRNNFTLSGNEEEMSYYKIRLMAYKDGSSAGTPVFRASAGSFNHEVVVEEYVSPRSAYLASALHLSYHTLSDCDTNDWSFGAFGVRNGYPCTVEFHQGRLWFGGTPGQPQTLWASRVDDFSAFTPGIPADSPMILTMAASQQNRISWIASLRGLMIGTSEGEWRLSATNSEGLNASNAGFERHSGVGSASLDALSVENSLLFVQQGGMKVRELFYSLEADGYQTRDVSLLSDHLLGEGIVDWTVQRSTAFHVWCVLGDGSAVCMTLNREQNVVAWHAHRLEHGRILSVASLRGSRNTPDEEVWFAVARGEGEEACITVECMADGNACLDACTEAVVKGETLSGLSHLAGCGAFLSVASLRGSRNTPDEEVWFAVARGEGEEACITVECMADGNACLDACTEAVVKGETLSGLSHLAGCGAFLVGGDGACMDISVDGAGNAACPGRGNGETVSVGLAAPAEVRTMPLETLETLGCFKKQLGARVLLHESTLKFRYGTGTPEAWKDFQPGRYSVSEPYSGYVRMIHNYGMDEQSSFALRVETPAPFNLLALVLDVEL